MRTQGIRGFTLVELLTSFSITAILATLSISGVTTLIETTARQNAIYELTVLLQQARSLAVSRGRRAFVCSINAADACISDWQGAAIGVVIDNNGNRERDHDEAIVYRRDWNPTTIKLAWSNRLRDPSITFQPHGTVVSNGTLTLKDKHGATFAKLIVNNGGRVRLEKVEAADPPQL